MVKLASQASKYDDIYAHLGPCDTIFIYTITWFLLHSLARKHSGDHGVNI